MASGYLDLAYLIEISIVFNLAYREIKQAPLLDKIKRSRERMSKDIELQERITTIKQDNTLAGNVVESKYKKMMAIVDCDGKNSKDCLNSESSLCEAWKHNEKDCKDFVKTLSVKRNIFIINISILVALSILLYATVVSHISTPDNETVWWWLFDIFVTYSETTWWWLFAILVMTIFTPIYLLWGFNKSQRIINILIGKNGNSGLMMELEDDFNQYYNQYLEEKTKGAFIE